jgi:multidrug resistance efflux pump
MTTSSQNQASFDHESDPNFLANALRDLARGERTAAALEDQLTSLEAKIEALLATADAARAASDDDELDEVDLEARFGAQCEIKDVVEESGKDEATKNVTKETAEVHQSDAAPEAINGTSGKEKP